MVRTSPVSSVPVEALPQSEVDRLAALEPDALTDGDLDAILSFIPGYDPWRGAEAYRIDYDEIRKRIAFFCECVTHVKGELDGEPYTLETWERAIVANLFGWKDRATGLRRFREAFVMVGRGNSKTTFGAGLVLCVMVCDGEPGAEIYSCAAERGQAKIAFDIARFQVIAESALSSRIRVFANSMVLLDSDGVETNTVYKPLSRDASSKHGFGPHFVLSDEIHCQPDRKLIDALATGKIKRREPLTVHLTTADVEGPSICNEKHDRAREIRDGLIDNPTFLPVLYEAAPDDDWHSVATWRKANPNLDKSIRMSDMEAAHKEAVDTPSFENTFKRDHLCIRTQSTVAAIPLDTWDACAERTAVELLRGRECWGGMDLSATMDMTALELLFPDPDDPDAYDVLSYFWVPEKIAEKRERLDRGTYETWIRSGHVTATQGNQIDYDMILRDIEGIKALYSINQIMVDTKFQGIQFSYQLDKMGIKIASCGSTWNDMAAPSGEFERLVSAGKIRHGGHPVLRWHVGNMMWQLSKYDDTKRPSKGAARKKIDGAVSCIMALRVAMARESARSVYAEPGRMMSF